LYEQEFGNHYQLFFTCDHVGEEGERTGYQTVRTCRSGAMLPSGCDEMIIDCYRMVESAKIDEFGNVLQV
jgi:hypothetical protein